MQSWDLRKYGSVIENIDVKDLGLDGHRLIGVKDANSMTVMNISP